MINPDRFWDYVLMAIVLIGILILVFVSGVLIVKAQYGDEYRYRLEPIYIEPVEDCPVFETSVQVIDHTETYENEGNQGIYTDYLGSITLNGVYSAVVRPYDGSEYWLVFPGWYMYPDNHPLADGYPHPSCGVYLIHHELLDSMLEIKQLIDNG